MCYCEASDSLLIAESDAHRIHGLTLAIDKRKLELKRALDSALIESDALPIQP